MGHLNHPIRWLNSIGSFPLLTKWEVCYAKQFELLFRSLGGRSRCTLCFKTCILHQNTVKKLSSNSEKHCSCIALVQQSADIVLIEEERTLFNTTNPYQDIKNQSCEHSGRMENSKVMIFNYKQTWQDKLVLNCFGCFAVPSSRWMKCLPSPGPLQHVWIPQPQYRPPHLLRKLELELEPFNMCKWPLQVRVLDPAFVFTDLYKPLIDKKVNIHNKKIYF